MDEKEYLWYKLCVFYHAKTEIFDRGLTTLRSRYDLTEAYIIGENRIYSNRYALSLKQFIMYVAKKLNITNCHLNAFIGHRLSAQGWIDEYYRLKDNGEMDFINKYMEI